MTAASAYLATDLPCGDCGAAKGDRCAGTRFCASRIQAALALARAGQLASHCPAAVAEAACSACSWFNGKHWASTNQLHRCVTRSRAGQCPYAVESGSRHCSTHAGRASAQVRSAARKSKLTSADVQAMRVMKHDGKTAAEIGARFGVSEATVYARLKST